MPKHPNGGPGGPFDPMQPLQPNADGDNTPDSGSSSNTGGSGAASAASERRGPTRSGADSRAGASPTASSTPKAAGGSAAGGSAAGAADSQSGAAAAASDPATAQSAGGRGISERKKQYIIAPRQSAGGLHASGFNMLGMQPQGLQPLSLSSIEQALRHHPDIEIIDTITPRAAVGTLADGMSGGQGILVTRMTDQKAATLHLESQGRLLVERDQFLNLMEPVLRPTFVSNIIPTSGAAFTAVINVVGKDGAPVADCEVSLFGSILPVSAVTDGDGRASVSLYGESAQSIRGLYIKPKADYWSFYNRDPDISANAPNVVTLRALSDWPPMAGFPQQQTAGWGQKAMRMDQLPANFRGQGTRVAVIDSGVATTHDCLKGVRAGFDIVNKKTSPDTWNDDTLGHGTHCCGIIGAADLPFGIRGFAPAAEIHACKLFPGGQVSQLIDALEYCIEQQIDVVNLSLGGAEPSEALEQQLQRAKRAGVACIVAAGNSGGPVQYPASSPNVLAVAAIGKLNEFPPDSYHAQTISTDVDANGFFTASFSCYGPQVAVCAPGVAIVSTVPANNYAAWDGTSMAAPHITGLAALVLAHHPDFQGPYRMRNAERVERLFQHIRASARRVSQADPTRVGFGLPDVLIALGLQASPFSTTGTLPFSTTSAGAGPMTDGRSRTPQAAIGGWMGEGMQPASVRTTGHFDPFGLDQALAAAAASYGAGMLPGGLSVQQLATLTNMQYALGNPAYRGW